jgi:hypothetical protein
VNALGRRLAAVEDAVHRRRLEDVAARVGVPIAEVVAVDARFRQVEVARGYEAAVADLAASVGLMAEELRREAGCG